MLGDDPVLASRVPTGARRAMAVLGAWALGIAMVGWFFDAGVVLPASVWAGGAGVVIALALLARERWLGVLLLVACVLLSGAWTSLRWFEPAGASLAARLPVDVGTGAGTPIELRGIVTSEPRLTNKPNGALAHVARWSGQFQIFDIEARSVRSASGWEPTSGTLTVLAGEQPASVAGIEPGRTVEIVGLYRPVRRPMNPGAYDHRLWSAERGKVGTLVMGTRTLDPAGATVSRLDRARAWASKVAGAARQRSKRAVLGESQEPSSARAVVGALVLGEREAGDSELRSAFARQGVAHLLAISGFHLVLVCAAVLFVVRTLTGGRWGAAEPIAVALVVAAYLVLVPARPPIVRSGMMVLSLLIAQALGRRHHGLGVIAWVGIAMLVWRPTWLFEIGFQFSFLMTGALIWLGRRVDARLARQKLDDVQVPPDVFDRKWWWALVRTPVSAGLVCWGAGVPIVAARFGWLSPLAVLSTVVLLPIVAAVLIVGAASAMLAALGLNVQASGLLEAMALPAAAWVETIDSWSLSRLRIAPIPRWLGWAGTVLVLAWMGAAAAHRRLLLAASAAWLLAAIGSWSAPFVMGPEATIDTFAVDDGTCIVVRSRGEALLWDAGSIDPAIGVWELPSAMRRAGIGRVRTAIVTHANFDHFSALPDLAGPLGLERVLVSDAFMSHGSERSVRALLDELDHRGVTVETISAGDELAIGSCTLTVLLALPPENAKAVNDESLVAVLEAPGGGRVLLTGDIQAPAMRALQATDVRADVLELPHHGSVHPDAVEFVKRVGPSVVLQSTSPSRAADPRWAGIAGTSVWRTTAIHGWSRVELGADTIHVRSMHGPRATVSVGP